jgi:hypothetical protein
MRNPKKRMIICLDEVDQIKFSIKDEILYNLTAISCGLISISNRVPAQFYNPEVVPDLRSASGQEILWRRPSWARIPPSAPSRMS